MPLSTRKEEQSSLHEKWGFTRGQTGRSSRHFILDGDNKIFSSWMQNSTQLEQQWLLMWNFVRRRLVRWTTTHKSKVKLWVLPLPLQQPLHTDGDCYLFYMWSFSLEKINKMKLVKSISYPQLPTCFRMIHIVSLFFFFFRGAFPTCRSTEGVGLATWAEEPAAAGPDRLPAAAGRDWKRVRPLTGKTCWKVHFQN